MMNNFIKMRGEKKKTLRGLGLTKSSVRVINTLSRGPILNRIQLRALLRWLLRWLSCISSFFFIPKDTIPKTLFFRRLLRRGRNGRGPWLAFCHVKMRLNVELQVFEREHHAAHGAFFGPGGCRRLRGCQEAEI